MVSPSLAHARELCAASLVSRGFKKRANHVFTCVVDKDDLGWLGLNGASNTPGGPAELSPVVGVRHTPLEDTLARIRGDRAHAYNPPSVSLPLTYTIPGAGYRSWSFTPDRAEAEAESLAQAADDSGRDFMKQHASLGGVLEALRSGLTASPDQATMRIPVALGLMGDWSEARAELERAVGDLGERTDLAAAALREFAVDAEAWINEIS